MITKTSNPVEWAMLMYELDDAKEHLETLIREMTKDSDFAEEDYRIQMAHIFSHLNRAWNTRDLLGTAEGTHEEFNELGRFPNDIEPI
jgi:hypothetical protein